MTSYDRMETCLWCVINRSLEAYTRAVLGKQQAAGTLVVSGRIESQNSTINNTGTQQSAYSAQQAQGSNRSHYHAANAMQQ